MILSAFFSSVIELCSTCRSLGLGLACWLLLTPLTWAQTVTTVVGGSDPYDVYVDGSGNLYVSDYSYQRIQKFPPNSTTATVGVTVAGGNGEGSAPNQLDSPTSVYVDGSGNLYVSDRDNHRVQKFPPNSTSATAGVTVAGGNGEGSAPNQLDTPEGVFVDGSGNLYVSDRFNSRIQKFPPNSTSATVGVTVAGGSNYGSAPNQLDSPTSVYVDGSGTLYVADGNNNRVQKFGPNSTSATAGVTVAGGNGEGSAPNQLSYPEDIYMDKAGNLYVSDYYNNRVQKFPSNSTSATAGVTVAGGNGRGFAPNQLDGPEGIYVDGTSNLYVSDGSNRRVQKYSYSPVITSQPPTSLSVCSGATVSAQVSASALTPITYQWYSASGPLSGQTSPTLTLARVQANQTSSYYVVVSTPDGTSTTSASLALSVLTPPIISVMAGGSLSSATPSVTLTASGGDIYQFGPGATQVGNGPTATVNAPGLYYVEGTATTGCSKVASVSVTLAPAPDLSPVVYLQPGLAYGTTDLSVVVDVVELNGVATGGLITLKINKDARLRLRFSNSVSSLAGHSVQNGVWVWDDSNADYYVLSTSQAVAGGGRLSVGLSGELRPGGTSGELTVSAIVVGGSGGEGQVANNSDTERLEYAQQ